MSNKKCTDECLLLIVVIIALMCCFSVTLVNKVLLCY